MNGKKESTRDKILDAAFRLLSAKGYANVSMRDIAKEAGVALSLLTYHFLTKENLFTALASRLVSTCFSEVKETLEKSSDEAERMHLMSDYFEQKLRNDKDMMRIYLDFSAQALWNKSFRCQVISLFDKLSDIIKNEILSESVRNESTILGKYSPDAVSKVILGSLYGTTFQLLIGKKDNPEEVDSIFALGNEMIDICRQ